MKIAVIAGRFQIDVIHYGHQKLLNQAYKECDKVIVFVGKAVVRSEANPLPSVLVEHSVRSNQGSSVEVHILRDLKYDNIWESELYSRVSELTDPDDEIVYYGSRDSFLDSLTDTTKTHMLVDSDGEISATDLRNKIGYEFTRDFKAGYIKAVQDEFKAHYAVVDGIITDGKDILLGRKESGWVIIGGFADSCDSDLESAIQREVLEETNLTLDRPEYFMSIQCRDWRYTRARQPFSSVFVFNVDNFDGAKAGDDILEVKVVPLLDTHNYISKDSFHTQIINKYITYVGSKSI